MVKDKELNEIYERIYKELKKENQKNYSHNGLYFDTLGNFFKEDGRDFEEFEQFHFEIVIIRKYRFNPAYMPEGTYCDDNVSIFPKMETLEKIKNIPNPHMVYHENKISLYSKQLEDSYAFHQGKEEYERIITKKVIDFLKGKQIKDENDLEELAQKAWKSVNKKFDGYVSKIDNEADIYDFYLEEDSSISSRLCINVKNDIITNVWVWTFEKAFKLESIE